MVGRTAESASVAELLQRCVGRGFDGGRLTMELEITELPFHHQDSGLHIGVLERHVGDALDVQSGCHLDDLSGDSGPRQRAADPRAQV